MPRLCLELIWVDSGYVSSDSLDGPVYDSVSIVIILLDRPDCGSV